MTLITALCAAGAGICLFAIIAVSVIAMGLFLWRVVSKSRDKGVVFKDGISNEEAKLVLQTINESISAEKAAETLARFRDALDSAVSKTPATPKASPSLKV